MPVTEGYTDTNTYGWSVADINKRNLPFAVGKSAFWSLSIAKLKAVYGCE